MFRCAPACEPGVHGHSTAVTALSGILQHSCILLRFQERGPAYGKSCAFCDGNTKQPFCQGYQGCFRGIHSIRAVVQFRNDPIRREPRNGQVRFGKSCLRIFYRQYRDRSRYVFLKKHITLCVPFDTFRAKFRSSPGRQR